MKSQLYQTIYAEILLAISQEKWYISKAGLRSSRPEVFTQKGALERCSKPTGEQSCKRVIQQSCYATLLKSHSTRLCPREFAAFLQNTSSQRHLSRVASVFSNLIVFLSNNLTNPKFPNFLNPNFYKFYMGSF